MRDHCRLLLLLLRDRDRRREVRAVTATHVLHDVCVSTWLVVKRVWCVGEGVGE